MGDIVADRYGNQAAEITIEDDDGDALVVSVVGGSELNAANNTDSKDRTVSYLLQLSKAINEPVIVNVSVASGTTAAPWEFNAPSTVTFAPNERVTTLPVSLFEAAAGGQKVIKLNLTSSSATVSDQTVTVNLLDVDSASGGTSIFLPQVVR